MRNLLTTTAWRGIFVGVAAYGLAVGTAGAVTIDFEDAGAQGVAVGDSVTTQFGGGITFRGGPDTPTQDLPILGDVGNDIEGWVLNEDPTPVQDVLSSTETTNIGSFFLGGINFDGTQNIELDVDYDSPTAALSFDIIDIDQRFDDAGNLTALEQFTITYFDSSSNQIGQQIFTAGDDDTGDGIVTDVSFGSLDAVNFASRFEIRGQLIDPDTEERVNGAIGIAFDNFDTQNPDPPDTVIPVPSALPLFLTGLAGLGFVGWRRRKG